LEGFVVVVVVADYYGPPSAQTGAESRPSDDGECLARPSRLSEPSAYGPPSAQTGFESPPSAIVVIVVIVVVVLEGLVVVVVVAD
jgi:hypothetical protein